MPLPAIPLDEATIQAHEALIEEGTTIAEACRAVGMSTKTYYEWGYDGRRAPKGSLMHQFFERVMNRRNEARGKEKEPPEALAKSGDIDQFEAFCGRLLLENRTPMVLHPFQRRMLEDFFDGVTESLIMVPKKNGKTTLLAALALFSLETTDDAECLIAAASRDQATILFNQAAGFVRRSGLEDNFGVRRGFREIRSVRDDGRIRVLASDADTADGVVPTLALVDELHRHKTADLYGVFRDGLGPRNGQIITISTAGDDENSPLGVLRRNAYSMGVERKGPYRWVKTPDFVMHEWALEAEQDRSDMELVSEANPAPWQTPEALRRRYDSPSMTPWQWARFACGIWTNEEQAWISADEWDACQGMVDLDTPADNFDGVDIGQVYDSSAVVRVAWVDGLLHVRSVRIWDPTPDRPIEIGEVEGYILKQSEEDAPQEVVYDPYRFGRSAEILEDNGLVAVEFNTASSKRMNEASTTLYDLIREGKVVHDGDTKLRAHVLNGIALETESGWKISKRKSKKHKIDALVALAMAAQRATENRTTSEMPMVEVFG